jgi:hypothetical protein
MGERRAALLTRITMMGGQSREFFIALAAAIGYTIWITEYRPFMVGIDRVGDPHYDIPTGTQYPAYFFGPPENRFYWTVHVGETRLTWFRVTTGQTSIDPHLRIGLATTFAGRVMMIMFKVAQNVASEEPGTAHHTERINYAGLVIRGEEKPQIVSAHVISSNPTIAAAIEGDPAKLGSNVPDGDIEFALASIWDSRSLAFYKGAAPAS